MYTAPKNQDCATIDGVAVTDLAEEYGTPLYIYSQQQLVKNLRKWQKYMRPQDKVFFAVKANHNLSLLRLIAKANFGFVVVSQQELARVELALNSTKDIIFSGVSKLHSELLVACQKNIFSLNIESESEFNKLYDLVQQHQIPIRFALRINPNIETQIHQKYATGHAGSKFGIDLKTAQQLYQKSLDNPYLKPVGVACHIGSQLQENAPLLQSLQQLIIFAENLRNQKIPLQFLDIGGGYSVKYRFEAQFNIKCFLEEVAQKLHNLPYQIVFEPGRSIIANAGFLLTQVQHLKQCYGKNFALTDAGMHNLMRPALYGAYHNITVASHLSDHTKSWNIAGPICENSDILGSNRKIGLTRDSLLLVHNSGAYCSVMANNYNSQYTCAEVLVSEGKHSLIKQKQTFNQLVENETPFL